MRRCPPAVGEGATIRARRMIRAARPLGSANRGVRARGGGAGNGSFNRSISACERPVCRRCREGVREDRRNASASQRARRAAAPPRRYDAVRVLGARRPHGRGGARRGSRPRVQLRGRTGEQGHPRPERHRRLPDRNSSTRAYRGRSSSGAVYEIRSPGTRGRAREALSTCRRRRSDYPCSQNDSGGKASGSANRGVRARGGGAGNGSFNRSISAGERPVCRRCREGVREDRRNASASQRARRAAAPPRRYDAVRVLGARRPHGRGGARRGSRPRVQLRGRTGEQGHPRPERHRRLPDRNSSTRAYRGRGSNDAALESQLRLHRLGGAAKQRDQMFTTLSPLTGLGSC